MIRCCSHQNHNPFANHSYTGKIQNLINKYHWESKNLLDARLLQNPKYLQFLELLYESRLIFTLRGYEKEGSTSPWEQGLHVDGQGQICLWVNQEWMSWEKLLELVVLEPNSSKIVSLANPKEEWNYFHKRGLVCQTRHNYIQPVSQLTLEEQNHLYNYSQKFFKNQSPQAIPRETCGFMQVFTSGAHRFKQLGHVGVRLISPQGEVYSLGFETSSDEISRRTASCFDYMGTANAYISSPDFQEFQKFDVRRVTTIPVTEENFKKLLEKVHIYAASNLRFNISHQNCCTFTADLLKTIDIQVDVSSSSFALNLLKFFFPFLEKIPLIGLLAKGMRILTVWIVDHTPPCIRQLPKFLLRLISYPIDLFKNVLGVTLGGTKSKAPLPEEVKHNLDNRTHLASFKRIFNRYIDFLNPSLFNITLPTVMVDWQKQQKTTHTYTFEQPRWYIVPPEQEIS